MSEAARYTYGYVMHDPERHKAYVTELREDMTRRLRIGLQRYLGYFFPGVVLDDVRVSLWCAPEKEKAVVEATYGPGKWAAGCSTDSPQVYNYLCGIMAVNSEWVASILLSGLTRE